MLLAADVLCELEDRRELSLSGLVTAFQRECRRHLATKWLQRRRVLETAIKCIQVRGVPRLYSYMDFGKVGLLWGEGSVHSSVHSDWSAEQGI